MLLEDGSNNNSNPNNQGKSNIEHIWVHQETTQVSRQEEEEAQGEAAKGTSEKGKTFDVTYTSVQNKIVKPQKPEKQSHSQTE